MISTETITASPTLQVTDTAIHEAFENITPELLGRLKTYSRRFPDPDSAYGEMLSFSWVNFKSKARRQGTFLPASQLAYISCVRVRSGRTLNDCGYSVKDALAEGTFKAGRSRVYYLSQTNQLGRHALPDEASTAIAAALTTRARLRPDEIVATKLDWVAFARQQPVRMRRILRMLVIGFSKSEIAARLKITRGRLSQLLRQLGGSVLEFFGDNLPVTFA